MIPIEKNIIVIDENQVKRHSTYLRRAKGLVKNGRAQWVDEKTIRLTSTAPPLCLPLNRMGDISMTNKREAYIITERGARKSVSGYKYCPHNITLPAVMSILKTLIGIKPDIRKEGQWLNDYDYFFQMGVSTDGFAMLGYLPEAIMLNNLWNSQPIKDCFACEGIKYHMAALEDVAMKDYAINKQTIKKEIVDHLNNDFPVLIWCAYNEFFIAIGYEDDGNTILGIRIFGKGNSCENFMKKTKFKLKFRFEAGFADDVIAVFFIDGAAEPSDRKEITLRTLKIGYEMLTETKSDFSNLQYDYRLAPQNRKSKKELNEFSYGYGVNIYEKWISRIKEDNNYKYKKDALLYASPEDFDLAERRAYVTQFFKIAQQYLGDGCLSEAIDNYVKLHNGMWKIHRTARNEGRMLSKENRDKIIAILEDCKEYDKIAAENIGNVLKSYHRL